MCGRFNLRLPSAQLAEIFHLLRAPDFLPRYNIAPTQPVAAIRTEDGQRELALLHWGLIPSWAKDPKMGARMINARAETVAEKPSFRSAFRRHRCLIPASGFYEWKQTDSRVKQPYHIAMRDDRAFAFAGLWEHWNGNDGSEIESCTIITTEANEFLKEIHDRMPVILHADDHDRWLDPKNENKTELLSLLTPYPAEEMRADTISTLVNNVRNDSPECLAPVNVQTSLFPE